jgi:hypothetical protein
LFGGQRFQISNPRLVTVERLIFKELKELEPIGVGIRLKSKTLPSDTLEEKLSQTQDPRVLDFED